MRTRGTALVTGVTGQDGSFLAEELLSAGYDVLGTRRPTVSLWTHHPNLQLAQKIASSTGCCLRVADVDLSCTHSVRSVMRDARPTLIFNLAAQSHVGTSFSRPEYTLDITGIGAARVIDAAIEELGDSCRVYQASSSEMFGDTGAGGVKLSSASQFSPRSPYAAAKLLAHNLAALHRKRGAFVSAGILFNHESERRGETFVTRKITKSIASIKLGLTHSFGLGDTTSRRDWGYAPDYVSAMMKSLEVDEPCEFVLGTGVSGSVQDFLEAAAGVAGIT